MSTYIHFTDEQKQRAASVDLEEFLRCRGEKLLTSGREKRLARDHITGCTPMKKARTASRKSSRSKQMWFVRSMTSI